MERTYCVYILANRHHTVLYTGVTNDLVRRVVEHRAKLFAGFAPQYNVDKLVFFEAFTDVIAAIAREKQIKGGSRAKKAALIAAVNPDWADLYERLSSAGAGAEEPTV
jgi:putative endonuclease